MTSTEHATFNRLVMLRRPKYIRHTNNVWVSAFVHEDNCKCDRCFALRVNGFFDLDFHFEATVE